VRGRRHGSRQCSGRVPVCTCKSVDMQQQGEEDGMASARMLTNGGSFVVVQR
jgi:hypothetical protein